MGSSSANDESEGSDTVAVDAEETKDDLEESMLSSLAVNKKSRRSSLSNVTPSYYQTDLMKEDKRRRRASLSGGMPSLGDFESKPTREDLGEGVANAVLGPKDGYDAETDGEMSTRSMRSMQRRASMKAQRRLSNSHAPPGAGQANNLYGNTMADDDTDCEEPSQPVRAQRRMSSGVKQPRRASNNYGYEPQPMMSRRGSAGGASRRGSNGVNTYGYESQPMMNRRGSAGGASRRGSNGVNTYGYEMQPPMNRRGSAGGASRRGSNGVDAYGYEPQTMNRRGSAGGASRRGSNGVSVYEYGDPAMAARRPSNARQRRASNQGFIANGPPPDYHESDSESEVDMGYGYNMPYQSRAAPPVNRSLERRPSNASRASQRSRRRNSCLIRKDQDPMVMREIMMGPSLVPDSDLEDTDGEDNRGRGAYGYGAATPYSAPKNASESESENTVTTETSRRRARRNSCIIRPDQDPFTAPATTPIMPSDDEDIHDDYNDPDSLLNRSRFGKVPAPALERKTTGQSMTSGVKALDDLVRDVSQHQEEKKKTTKVVNEQPTTMKKEDPWMRKTPLTTAHATLTEERLAKKEKAKKIATSLLNKEPTHGSFGWGNLDFESDDDSSSEETDEEAYGPGMYEDNRDFEEIDRYKQRARRRSSIERSCVDIIQSQMRKVPNMPKFTPAETFSNAADYVVRAFTARMRLGIKVVKHNQSRWSKSTYRELVLLSDGKTLTWKPLEGEKDKGRRPKLDLTKCIEVRHALSRDPSTRRHMGTAVLRKRCKEGTANKSFALIFKKRTLDLTALNMDQCLLMLEGFSALCFRLKLDRAAEGKDDASELESQSAAMDDDWASTVYGESTASMTHTNVSSRDMNPPPLLDAPWGL